MWNSGTLACSQESTECEGFFSCLSLCPPPPLSLSRSSPSLFFLCAGLSYISPMSPGAGDWRSERERARARGAWVVTPSRLTHWDNRKPSLNKWSERKRKHLWSKSSFSFFYFFLLHHSSLSLCGTSNSGQHFLKPYVWVPQSFPEDFLSPTCMFELHVPFVWSGCFLLHGRPEERTTEQSRARFKLALSVVLLLLLLQIQLFLTEAIPCCLTLRWLLALNVIKPH